MTRHYIEDAVNVGHNGAEVASRGMVNLIDGTNVTLTVADNAGADRVDVTVASTASGSGFIAYDQITASVTVTSSTEATPTTIITCAAHTFDGNPVLLTFSTQGVFVGSSASGDGVLIGLFESTTEIDRISTLQVPVAGSFQVALTGQIRFTPTAGSHTYTIAAWNLGTPNLVLVVAGAGGAAVNRPAFALFQHGS